MTESRAGAIAVPEVVPRLSATPGEIRWLGEGLGAQNDEIFRDLLGLKDSELRKMRDDGVI
jgi:crotonobetainyl-CoA:carnitine CoA-transferase CaiB-like acyl-CoA transferase